MNVIEKVRKELRRLAKYLSPEDLDNWNTTSWTNIIQILSGVGELDGGIRFDATMQDRAHAAVIVGKALDFLYDRTPLERRELQPPMTSREFFAKQFLPLPAKPGESEGLNTLRHVALAARYLVLYEEDPGRVSTIAEMVALSRAVGLGR